MEVIMQELKKKSRPAPMIRFKLERLFCFWLLMTKKTNRKIFSDSHTYAPGKYQIRCSWLQGKGEKQLEDIPSVADPKRCPYLSVLSHYFSIPKEDEWDDIGLKILDCSVVSKIFRLEF